MNIRQKMHRIKTGGVPEMKKKMLAMILCLALVVPAAACGSASTGAAQGQAEEAAEETAPTETTEETADRCGAVRRSCGLGRARFRFRRR